MQNRPDFCDISSYQEFSKYYWYRDELKNICKDLGIDYSGNKSNLNHNIEEYFNGNLIKKIKKYNRPSVVTRNITLDTKLLECGFCFNKEFRDFFASITGVANFKFNANMVATARKVKEDFDMSFTLRDMLDVYYGKKEYATYDNSSCEWNRFFKDFCSDFGNNIFNNKLKVASILWSEVRNSTNKKVYTKDLVNKYYDKIKCYINSKE